MGRNTARADSCVKHRANIKRLLKGEEPKLSFSKK